eukprot:1679287-Prymnesium_polylepis.1
MWGSVNAYHPGRLAEKPHYSTWSLVRENVSGGVVGLQRRVEPPPSGRGRAAAARCDPTCRNFHP